MDPPHPNDSGLVRQTLWRFSNNFNKNKSYSERKMLSMVLHLLKDSSKDETGVRWKWWDRHNRKALWYQALTWRDVSIQRPVLNDHLFNHTTQSDTNDESLFVLWIHCIDWEGYECMMNEVEFRRLYDTWRKWRRNSREAWRTLEGENWDAFDVGEQCLPSQGNP